jgi:hypothetical protein
VIIDASAVPTKVVKTTFIRIDTSRENTSDGGRNPEDAACLFVASQQALIATSPLYHSLYCVILYQELRRLAKSFGETPMNLKSLQVVSLTVVAAALLAAPAIAHHSFAMFDAQTTVTLDGTVKEFEWVNPHSWLRVMVKDEKTGQQVMWALELSSPSRLVTMGMRSDSVKAGDAVSVTFHPLRNGARGGQFIQAVLPGGKKVLRANARDENEP